MSFQCSWAALTHANVCDSLCCEFNDLMKVFRNVNELTHTKKKLCKIKQNKFITETI